MALISTYGPTNRVIDEDLSVTYSADLSTAILRTNSSGAIYVHRGYVSYTRHATKSYSYVGLAKDKANILAAALRTYYTRATKLYYTSTTSAGSTVIGSGNGPNVLMADVACRHDAGDMWSVIVSVRESDVAYSKSVPSSVDVTSFFTAENARGYDTSSSDVEITSSLVIT